MSEDREDREIESFLRQFQPCRPSPLPVAERRLRPAWRALVAATLAAAAVWVSLPVRPRPVPAPVPAVFSPTALEANPRPTLAELSVVLRPAESSRATQALQGQVLADPTRPGGALFHIASAGPGR